MCTCFSDFCADLAESQVGPPGSRVRQHCSIFAASKFCLTIKKKLTGTTTQDPNEKTTEQPDQNAGEEPNEKRILKSKQTLQHEKQNKY